MSRWIWLAIIETRQREREREGMTKYNSYTLFEKKQDVSDKHPSSAV